VQKAAQDAYDYQLDATTNSAWAITYKNASGDLIEVKGNGLATFEAKVADLKHFTITDGYFYYAGMEVGFVGNEGCELFCKDQNETTATLKTALDEANAAVDANERTRQIASQGIVTDTAKLEALDYENTKAQLNTAIGAQTAVVINICGSL